MKDGRFWEVKFDEKVGPIAFIDNRVVCFYAQSEDRKVVWRDNTVMRMLNGEKLGFLRKEIQGSPISYTQQFTYKASPPAIEPPID